MGSLVVVISRNLSNAKFPKADESIHYDWKGDQANEILLNRSIFVRLVRSVQINIDKAYTKCGNYTWKDTGAKQIPESELVNLLGDHNKSCSVRDDKHCFEQRNIYKVKPEPVVFQEAG